MIYVNFHLSGCVCGEFTWGKCVSFFFFSYSVSAFFGIILIRFLIMCLIFCLCLFDCVCLCISLSHSFSSFLPPPSILTHSPSSSLPLFLSPSPFQVESIPFGKQRTKENNKKRKVKLEDKNNE